MIRSAFLSLYDVVYRRAARPLLFRSSAQAAHSEATKWQARLDQPVWHGLLRDVHRLTFADQPVEVGGVRLPYPFMLAAGVVKGAGFASEAEASRAATNENIIPGWRGLPLLVGPVEFGSFTPWPRAGNPGVVVWRDPKTQSTQNRIGLRNPGARAAAAFLTAQRDHLPPVYGINLAPSPGVTDTARTVGELRAALCHFLEAGVLPSWFTLNLSCPNTEDDPDSRQTERGARDITRALTELLRPANVPLWVKVSPGLADEQYRVLMGAFADSGVRAVVATNTLGAPSPDDAALIAGVGGGKLLAHALAAVRALADERTRGGYDIDLIGCGGVMDATSVNAYFDAGASAVQYWSALIYRGPLAGALLLRDKRGLHDQRY